MTACSSDPPVIERFEAEQKEVETAKEVKLNYEIGAEDDYDISAKYGTVEDNIYIAPAKEVEDTVILTARNDDEETSTDLTINVIKPDLIYDNDVSLFTNQTKESAEVVEFNQNYEYKPELFMSL